MLRVLCTGSGIVFVSCYFTLVIPCWAPYVWGHVDTTVIGLKFGIVSWTCHIDDLSEAINRSCGGVGVIAFL